MSEQSERTAIIAASCFCLLVAGVVALPGARHIGKRPLLESSSRERGSDIPRDAPIGALRSLPDESRSTALPSLEAGPEECEAPLEASLILRGRVVRIDGFQECRAEVWNSNAHAFASIEGEFEISGASLEHPLHATLPGFQPAREDRPGRDGIVLRLGPPTLQLVGRLCSEEGRESEGWRIALLDAALIEPVRADAATLESASSRAPLRVQSAADGSFCIDGLGSRPYTLAAWRAARERIEIHAAPPATPGQGTIEVHIPPTGECRTIELRCIDSKAAPLARLRVGLPGAPAIASTDALGRLVLSGALPPQLTLVVSTPDGSARSQVADTAASADIVIDLP